MVELFSTPVVVSSGFIQIQVFFSISKMYMSFRNRYPSEPPNRIHLFSETLTNEKSILGGGGLAMFSFFHFKCTGSKI